MPLNKSALEQSIKNAFKSMKNSDTDEEQGLDRLCSKLAEAVDTYVRTAQINYIAGLSNSGGAVSGVFNGNLS